MQLSSAVPVLKDAVYIASYHSSAGYYVFSSSFFTNAVDNGPLHALANATSSNGVYRYGASGFPTSTYQASNYWADVVYRRASELDSTRPTITTLTPADAATGVGTDTDVSARFDEPMDPATITASNVSLRTTAGAAVTTTLSYDSTTRTATLEPQTALLQSTNYTATVKGGATGVKDLAGNALASDRTWTFTTGVNADTTAPTVSITSPSAGNVTGTIAVSANAADAIGVTGVQFRLDGTALGAEDTASPYSVSWNTTTATPGPHTLTAVARDAAGNTRTSAPVNVTVVAPAGCPCSIWPSSTSPASPVAVHDSQPIEVGTKFRADENGTITALRFYKGTGDTGTHVGHLWSSTGTQLAQVNFTGRLPPAGSRGS